MAGTGLEAKTAGRRSDRHRPCSKAPADDPAGTGLAAKHQQTIRPAQALQQNSQPMKLASLCLAVEVGGDSAVVLATQKVGSDLPYCFPPNLSPLPVSVHTHSLNLSKTN